ncbi:MAG: Crp/Fnr family transcriptional regulator [Spirochaetales bacterium]|nr:Crp/Fnr family transcriptional regulator [Spirochaetales bacterium]
MGHPSLWLEEEFSTLKKVLNSTSPLRFNAGKIIYKQHDRLNRFYLIEKGIVKISIFSEDGQEKIIGFQSDNSLFGMDCFCKPCTAVVTATAITEVYIYYVTHSIIESLIEKNPGIGIELAKYYSKLLKLMCLQTEYQSFHDTLNRLINYFMLYTRENSTKNSPIIIHLTEEEISALVASSRVNVSRVLKKLKEHNIIEKKRGKITIQNPERLIDLCHLPYFDEHVILRD